MRSISLIALVLTSSSAYAYVGPGLGLGVLGAILGALVTLVLAIFGVVWYPIKRLLKKKKATEPKGEKHTPNENDQERQRSEDVD